MSTSPLPQSTTFLIKQVQRGINRVLDYDADTRAALEALEGRVLAIEIGAPAWQLFLLPGGEGLRITLERPPRVDVTIAGRPLALLGMLTRRDAAQGHVEIRGDIHLAQRFQQIMRGLDIDWEEFLAGHVGDLAAHQLGRFGRRLRDQLQASGLIIRQQFADYIQYEQGLLPLRYEFEVFSQSVDELRDDVERAEQRLRRLNNQRSES